MHNSRSKSLVKNVIYYLWNVKISANLLNQDSVCVCLLRFDWHLPGNISKQPINCHQILIHMLTDWCTDPPTSNSNDINTKTESTQTGLLRFLVRSELSRDAAQTSHIMRFCTIWCPKCTMVHPNAMGQMFDFGLYTVNKTDLILPYRCGSWQYTVGGMCQSREKYDFSKALTHVNTGK